jgi:hypothetical protein
VGCAFGVSIRGEGNEFSPGWFLDEKDVGGGDLENALEYGSLFVSVNRENGKD